jgi:hypothetical protein
MSIELVFSTIVILLCMMIFFRTRSLYGLTKHRGISYFRNTFLFFALAFLFRLGFHLFSLSGIVFDFRFPRQLLGPLPLLVTTYFSTIAILYLLLSLVWKRINTEHFLIVSHVVAFTIAVIVFMFRSPQVLFISQLLLIAFTLGLAYLRSRRSKSFSKVFTLYLLLFIAWLANIIVLSPRLHLPLEVNVASYAVSTVIFAIIFYKVYRWTK